MTKRKFDVSRTFETFNSETINNFNGQILKLVFIEANEYYLNKSCIVADISNDTKTYLTVLNNQNVFNLINNSIKKQNSKNNNENI